MRYFQQLPKIEYTFSNGIFTIPDLFTKVGFKDSFFENPDLFYEEYFDKIVRPERLSFLKYGTFDYYWIMMLANKVYDVNRDWPIQQEELGTLLNNYSKKATYYVYENAEILPNDILYLNENSYGIIESWNPFYKQIVLKENFNLPTNNFSSFTFKIKRLSRLSNSSQIQIVDLTNFCTTPSTNFQLFGYSMIVKTILVLINHINIERYPHHEHDESPVHYFLSRTNHHPHRIRKCHDANHCCCNSFGLCKGCCLFCSNN